MQESNKNIVFFDGKCGFCHFWVKWLLKRDKKHTFYFASLDSSLAHHYKLQALPQDTLILIYKNTIYTKSRAVAVILAHLSFPYRVLSAVIMLFPVCWSDRIYSLIAANRKVLGKNKTCRLQNVEPFKSYILR